MRSTKIKLKVCGMRDGANIIDVAGLGPDYLGFIFHRGSRRYVGEHFIIPPVQHTIKRVGVFVNQTTEEITSLAAQHGLDFIQLHGSEAPEQCSALVSEGLKLIKAFSVGSRFDFAVLEPYRQYVEFVLFDTAGQQPGGNGMVFDWDLLKHYDQSIPFFLAGGLSPKGAGWHKLQGMNIHALDINSGVEDTPGMKNIGMIHEMLNIRNQWL